ncbi:MAG: hypothetical protein ACXW5U_12510 [Thermoanaerobaculia bacterium]
MVVTTTPGTRLGPYEVVAPIGAGGMGQVWRARDSRLDRTVAIKVLPSDFARDARLRVRLEREAKWHDKPSPFEVQRCVARLIAVASSRCTRHGFTDAAFNDRSRERA